MPLQQAFVSFSEEEIDGGPGIMCMQLLYERGSQDYVASECGLNDEEPVHVGAKLHGFSFEMF